MSVFRHLKSLFPIPDHWSEDGRKFALRLEEAYRSIQIENESTKAEINTAIGNRAYGKRMTKAIAANANSCRIDFPGGMWLLSLSLPSLSKTWFGIVYVTSAGVVSVDKMCNQTGISIATGENCITATFTQTSDTTLHMVAIPLRSNTFPEFH